MYHKILVPVDGSAASMRGVSEAIKLAKSHGSQVQLVHVVNETTLAMTEAPIEYLAKVVDAMRGEGNAILASAQRALRDQALEGESVLLEAVGGRAADRIVEQAKAWNADLIVMGTHGRRGLLHLALGSDAERVVRLAPVPVLLVRADVP